MRKIILVPFIVSLFLAIIPFFWLQPGWMDLGGDSSRLYFYDPINFLKSSPLYGLAPDGFASENISYYLIPFVLLLAVFKEILRSPYHVITLFNSFQLVISFLSIYAISREFLKGKEKNNGELDTSVFAGCIAGLFYILSPFLAPNGWDKAMFIHNQLFLNPLVFFLLLKYIHTKKMQYLLSCALVTFIFAANFSPSPAFFAFYPLAILYLLFYNFLIKGTILGIKNIALIFLLFFIVHAFHLVPSIINLFFSSGNVFYEAAFSHEGKFVRGLGYFSAVAATTKLTNNVLSLPQGESSVAAYLEFLWFTFPVLLVLGLLAQKKMKHAISEINYNFLLLFSFFLLTLFLSSAVITHTGLALYKLLFNIPGFSMFRNYVGQFSFVFIFFYSLTLSYALFYIFSYVDKQKKIILFVALLVIIVISSWSFIRGDMINLVINKGAPTEMRVPIKMDPQYEQVLEHIRKDPIDARYLTLPFTEAGLQMLAGVEGGAYQGPSTIAYLAGKQDFSGYQVMYPFSEFFLRMVRDKDYEGLNTFLGMLNVKYIFYNSDPRIYGENFPGLPYSVVNRFMPPTQELYKAFIEQLAVKKKIDFGDKYHIYELDDRYFVPKVYAASNLIFFNRTNNDLLSFMNALGDRQAAFVTDMKFLTILPLQKEIFQIPPEQLLYSTFKDEALIISSTVSQEIFSYFYPFILLEQIINTSQIKEYDISFDERIYPLELERKNILVQTTYNKIKNQLPLYENTLTTLIEIFSNQQSNGIAILHNKARAYYILSQHRDSFVKKIINSSFTQQEKSDLTLLADRIFAEAEKKLQLPSALQKISYTSNVSTIPNNEYAVWIKTRGIQKSAVESISLQLDGRSFLGTEDQPAILHFPFTLKKDDKGITLFLQGIFRPDIITFISNEKEAERKRYAVVAKGIFLGTIQTIISRFTSWTPNTFYLVSFTYQEKNLPNVNHSFSMLVEVNRDATVATLLVENNNPNPFQYNQNQGVDFIIKNLSVLKIPLPEAFLVADKKKNEKIELPIINSLKIDPTRYVINVSAAKDPYTLIFLNNYSKNWHLSLLTEGPQQVSENFIMSFLNIFFQQKQYVDATHFPVNGVSNAWYISPENVGGKQDYILILEHKSTQLFFVSLMLSLCGVFACLLWVGMLVWKKRVL